MLNFAGLNKIKNLEFVTSLIMLKFAYDITFFQFLTSTVNLNVLIRQNAVESY